MALQYVGFLMTGGKLDLLGEKVAAHAEDTANAAMQAVGDKDEQQLDEQLVILEKDLGDPSTCWKRPTCWACSRWTR
jgi:hypothetical protein